MERGMCRKHFTQYKSADIWPSGLLPWTNTFLFLLTFSIFYISFGVKNTALLFYIVSPSEAGIWGIFPPVSFMCIRIYDLVTYKLLKYTYIPSKSQKNGNTLTRMSFIYIRRNVRGNLLRVDNTIWESSLVPSCPHFSCFCLYCSTLHYNKYVKLLLKKSNWTLFMKPLHFYKDNICIFQLSSWG